MARFSNPLDHVRVAAPCKADWDQMIGSDRMRFCGQCSLNVYNLSSMIRSEAESLISRNEGRLCVRFYRRHDGSIITRDCPIGLRAIRRRLSYAARAIGSMILGLFAGLGVHEAFTMIAPFEPHRTMGVMAKRVDPLIQIADRPIAEEGRLVMGDLPATPPRHRARAGQSRNSLNR